MMSLSFYALIAILFSLKIGVSNAADVKEKWGYANVRKDAYMFWWLFHTDQDDYSNRPLVLWIQGGPSISGTGLGNFLEIGPFDENLKSRNSTWLTRANLLFLDNPVGTGFSYVTDKSALTRTNAQIAKDLLTALIDIFEQVPEFQKSPLYIVSESYGGKMTVDFALVLTAAIKNETIKCNFKAIALGDSWISPLDHVSTWGDYYYALSLLDSTELATVKAFSRRIRRTLENKQYKKAVEQYSQLQDMIDKYTNDADWFNVLKNGVSNDRGCFHGSRIGEDLFDKLYKLMNGPIRQKLRDIPENVTWNHRSPDVFEALEADFMKGVLPSVDRLLTSESQIEVNIYNGQLDPIVNILGVSKWINRLKWPDLNGFQTASKQPIMLPGNRTSGFYKSYKQLNFFWILKAGHYLPADAAETSLRMLDMILAKK